MLLPSCESSKPPSVPSLTLNLYVAGPIPEAIIDSNCYIGADLIDNNGVPIPNYGVDFTIEPSFIPITPYAITDPTKDNGLSVPVYFNYSQPDTVLVTGVVTGAIMDQISIPVRPVGNEN